MAFCIALEICVAVKYYDFCFRYFFFFFFHCFPIVVRILLTYLLFLSGLMRTLEARMRILGKH